MNVLWQKRKNSNNENHVFEKQDICMKHLYINQSRQHQDFNLDRSLKNDVFSVKYS